MRTITQAVFDDEERQVFEGAALGLYVAFPQPEGRGADKKHRNPDGDAHASLSRATTPNEPWSREQLVKLRSTLEKIRDVCDVERKAAYWAPAVEDIKGRTKEVEAQGRVPLFLDPAGAILMIVEARQQFYDDAVRALEIVNDAIPRTTRQREDVMA